MADTPPVIASAEGYAASNNVTNPPASQLHHIHPLLRQRMINRAATLSEGARPKTPTHPSLPRQRTSSIISDLSDSRYSFRSSTDNLLRTGKEDSNMNPLTATEEATLWDSLPLAFAILPAVGGLLFQNGSAVVTDLLLLALGSMFLNWCVRAPWDWYHSAQRVRYVSEDNGPDEHRTIIEEDETGYNDIRDREGDSPGASPIEETPKPDQPQEGYKKEAQAELAREEIWALVACFIGPLLGAYLLHTLRDKLSRPAEGLVSNYNLTIFVMAAELRPVSHMIKMKKARMLHLQRIVRPDFDSENKMSKTEAEELSQRLADVEARLTEPAGKNDMKSIEISSSVRQSLQPQLDALNRAVRRYEKRQAAQAIQIEARFGDLEMRLKDALSLAAAAARTGQRPGMVAIWLRWITNIVRYWTDSIWAIATYPLRVATSIFFGAKSLVIPTDRTSRKRTQANSGSYTPVPTSRMQSKSGR